MTRTQLALHGIAGCLLTGALHAQVEVDFDRTDYGACLDPEALVLGEFDGNAGLDMAYACRLSDSLNYRPNLGDGSFGDAVTLFSIQEPESLNVGDVDGNGLDDLCVTSRTQKRVFTLVQSAPGQFTATSVESFVSPFGSTRLADVDGDGWDDLLIGRGGDPAELLIHRSLGDGTYAAPISIPIWDRATYIAPCDLNLDGELDLITCVESLAGTGSILIGKPGLDFEPFQFFPGSFGSGPLWMQVADFTGDGLPDAMAVEEDGFEVDLILWPGNGDGTLGAWSWFAFSLFGPERPALGDFNGDGKPDLVAETTYMPGNVHPWIGDALGDLYPGDLVPISDGFAASAAGDLNGDGYDDLVVSTTGSDRINVLLAVPQDFSSYGATLSSSFFGNTHLVAQKLGPDFAGLPYWLLGSATGTFPGLTIDGLDVPLIVDDYTWLTLLNPGGAFLQGSPGVLGPDGDGFGKFDVSFGDLPPELSGLTLHHAFAVFDPLGGVFVHFSEPVPLAIQ